MQRIRSYKRVLIYGIFFLVISLLVGYFFHLKIEKSAIRTTVKAVIFSGLDRSELVFISDEKIHDPTFKWKDEAEFSLNGVMYDVVEHVTDGEQGYWCWRDTKETAVEQKIDRLYTFLIENNPKNSDRQFSYQTLLNSLYFNTDAVSSVLIISSQKHHINQFTERIVKPYHSEINAPPELS